MFILRSKKNLWTGPERVRVFLPLNAKDETKERLFKQELTKDTKKIIETLSMRGRSMRGKLSTYWQSFKSGNIMPLRILAYMPSGFAIYAPLISPLLSIIPIAYVAAVEGLSYRASEKDRKKVIRNLEKLSDNVSVHYIKSL